MRLLACFLLSLAAAAAWPAGAQDIPGRVGRLSYIDGSVGLYQDPERGWDTASVNSPITSRNSVWTEPGARAEVVVGPMALRLDETSQLDVSSLDDATLDATLERGSVDVNIRHFRAGDVVRLSTMQAGFLLQAQGRYRLDADPESGQSRLSVFSGTAAMETAGGRVRIRAGQSVVVWGEDVPQYAFEDVRTADIDRWAMARDARWRESRAPQYVSYEMTGYEDLDAYGEWGEDPVYGALWFPTDVQADWAPYRFGRWSYVQPWGWTWIDSEPWGYAPFHYGRWVHVRDRWAWCPGRRVDRPAWAPALVGFIGGGTWSASVSSGAPVVGWYPLAPSEPYRPWYSASRNYVTRVNAVVRKVPQEVARSHIEWNRDRAATIVRREALVEQRPVQQARLQVAPEIVRRAPAVSAPRTVLPSREEFHRVHRSEVAHAPAPRVAPRGTATARNEAEAPRANALVRPSFAKPSTKPRAAPSNAAPPPSAIARTPASAPAQPARASPAIREGEQASREARQQQERASREARQQQDGASREAQQQQERASREATAERERTAREARQRQESAAREAQQRERTAQQEQRAAQERSAREQRAEQQRGAREAEQQRQHAAQEQQRATREAEQQRQHAAQEQQRAAQQAEQQRQRATREAEQQRAARQAEQQHAREAEQQRQHAAQEQQRAAQQAEQQRQRAAREAESRQQRAAQEQQRAAAQQQQQREAQEQRLAAQRQQQQQRAAQEQQRAAQQQQRAAQEQQRAQERAAQEQQRAQQQHPQQQAARGRGESHEEGQREEHEKGRQGG